MDGALGAWKPHELAEPDLTSVARLATTSRRRRLLLMAPANPDRGGSRNVRHVPHDQRTSPRFLTLQQVGDELNISLSQTYALVRSGDLRGIQIGGRNQWRIERVMLEQYIADAYKRAEENLKDLPDDPPE